MAKHVSYILKRNPRREDQKEWAGEIFEKGKGESDVVCRTRVITGEPCGQFLIPQILVNLQRRCYCAHPRAVLAKKVAVLVCLPLCQKGV
jgi:hypothetical protein